MINWPIKLVESKYSRWYDKLIQKAQLRDKLTGYKETHHIVPRSFGGANNKTNLAELTAREHYIAHALLWKMKFPGVHGSKMAFAFNTFINKMQTKERGINCTYKINSRIYESFRTQYSIMLKEKWAKEGANFKGKKHSEETRRIIGEKSKLKEFKKGTEHPNWGKKLNLSSESIENKRNTTKEMWNDPIRKAKLLKSRELANQRPEVIAKRKAASDAKIGVKRDPASIEKTAAAKRGKKAHEIFSPQALANIAEGRKHRVYSPEAKEKMREISRMVGKRPKSEEHKRKISESNKGRKGLSGENSPNFGKKWSEEKKKEMSKLLTGRKQSKDTVEKRKQTMLANSKMCEYCDKVVNVTNYKRWHGNNCKTLR